jgi:hypothetical protein
MSYFHNDPDRYKNARLWVWFIAVSVFVLIDRLADAALDFMSAWLKLLR